MGLEPGNGKVDGRDVSREKGDLKFIAPGETISCKFTLKFFEGKKKLNAILNEQAKMK